VLLVVEPPNWKVTQDTSEKDHVASVATGPGTCRVEVDVWAGLPPTTGGPMVTSSSRFVVVDGRKLELVTTSQFHGQPAVVDALFVNDGTSYGRAVFRNCTTAQVDQALAAAKLSARVGSTP
jgi:hypothetical protein